MIKYELIIVYLNVSYRNSISTLSTYSINSLFSLWKEFNKFDEYL